MDLNSAFQHSIAFEQQLLALIDLPGHDDSPRLHLADGACDLSLDHWLSTRALLQAGLFPSAAVVHRAQFEAVLRSVWVSHAATESAIEKLGAELRKESEQAAKGVPQAGEMLHALSKSGPKPAYEALESFKSQSWMALNSYAHAGIHPLRRQTQGHPVELVFNLLCNANGLAVVSGMQAVALAGRLDLQRTVLQLSGRYSACMPTRFISQALP